MPSLAIFQLYLDMCINTVLLISHIVSHIPYRFNMLDRRGLGSHQLVLTLAIFLCLSQPWTWISNVIYHAFFFVFNELGQEVIACFVDIGGIVDHHYLNFHFITNSNIKVNPGLS